MPFELNTAQQTAFEILQDKVIAALETGNPGAARLALAEQDSNEYTIRLRTEALRDYGIRL